MPKTRIHFYNFCLGEQFAEALNFAVRPAKKVVVLALVGDAPGNLQTLLAQDGFVCGCSVNPLNLLVRRT